MARIRDIEPRDADAVVAINHAAVPAMNELDRDTLLHLVDEAAYARVILDDHGKVAGFLLVLGPGADYSSPNYQWFSDRFDQFLYIDRIAIDARVRGGGYGSALYDDLAAFARGRSPCILAEVNLDPPNPRSRAFHVRHGFVAVGELAHHYDGAHAQRVEMLKRDVTHA